MIRLYNTIPPIYLLLAGWATMGLAMTIRILSGQDFPVLNALYIPVSIGVYFLPGYFAGLKKGEDLGRKLLWLLVLAGVIILVAEAVRSLTGASVS